MNVKNVLRHSRVCLPSCLLRKAPTCPRRFRHPRRCLDRSHRRRGSQRKNYAHRRYLGSARDTVTDGAGFYNFASVPVGTYNLSVKAGGFKDYAASNISPGRR